MNTCCHWTLNVERFNVGIIPDYILLMMRHSTSTNVNSHSQCFRRTFLGSAADSQGADCFVTLPQHSHYGLVLAVKSKLTPLSHLTAFQSDIGETKARLLPVTFCGYRHRLLNSGSWLGKDKRTKYNLEGTSGHSPLTKKKKLHPALQLCSFWNVSGCKTWCDLNVIISEMRIIELML